MSVFSCVNFEQTLSVGRLQRKSFVQVGWQRVVVAGLRDTVVFCEKRRCLYVCAEKYQIHQIPRFGHDSSRLSANNFGSQKSKVRFCVFGPVSTDFLPRSVRQKVRLVTDLLLGPRSDAASHSDSDSCSLRRLKNYFLSPRVF